MKQWEGLSGQMTLRVMPAVALLLVGRVSLARKVKGDDPD